MVFKRVWQWGRVLIVGITVTAVVIGIALLVSALGHRDDLAQPPQPVDALAGSTDDCVTCHREESPGIVEQYAYSTMAAAGVTCRDCHEVGGEYPQSVAHEGTYVLNSPTPARCQPCHDAETVQFYASRHSLPAYVAYAGARDLSPEHQEFYAAIPEGTYTPDQSRSDLYVLEGQAITRFACEACHDIGQPQPDGSVGRCQDCHTRHTFSLEQARKPETCNACHIGPDHPQWEIYQESGHGISYMTGGDEWNWDAEPGTLTTVDLPAATCATCHISGFGTAETTHDVGDRLSWYLFAPQSIRRPDWEAAIAEMQGVCTACHNSTFIDTFYAEADAATEAVNQWVIESDAIIAPLQERGLLTAAPFDQPIDFTYFELWHHWSRTEKFGVWMQGPDYVQWHGAYEVLSDLAELRETASKMLEVSE
ncbi:MAG: nitrate reductase [Anaerolineae bacterium]|nr:nitrate reductase [Anaerolineae bacterium]